jgi:glycolate oxidase iron-sulfur subunit
MEPLGTAMRAELLAAGVVPRRSQWVMRALRILGRPRALERAMRLLRWAHRLKLVSLAGRVGLLRRFGVRADSIPVPPRRFLPTDGSGWAPVGRVPRETVELFAGCIMSTMFADLDVLTAELLAAAEYEVVVTDGQVCCGALSAHAGDLAVATEMAARNVAAFHSGRRIVSNSAGCGAFMKQYGEILGSDGESVARRIVDVSQLLAAEPPSFRAVELPGPVVYQDPCHARLAQGIISEPRTLLRAVPGLVLVEADEQDMCCGSAGVHNIIHPRTADELGRRKAHALVESGASIVVTSNPGCLMQVQAALRSIGSDLPVIHLVDLLRRALPDPVERTTAQRP